MPPRVMLFPADPALVAVIVTTFEDELALTPTVLPLPMRLIAAARFVASCVVLTRLDPDQYVKFAPVLLPLEPPLRVAAPHANPVRFVVVPMLFPPVPSVTAVTVTTLLLDDAVTPIAAKEVWQRLIVDARFEATVVVLELVAKVAVARVGHPFEPSVPRVGAAHVKMLVLFVAPTEMVLPALPSVVDLTVTVLPLALAVTPTAAGHRAIAAARFEASVVVLLLVAKVPVVELGQLFVPAELPVTLPHEKPVRLSPTERKFPGFVAVTVTVLPPALAVTPTAAKDVLQALIAAARFVAKSDVAEAFIKVPLVELGHVCVPSVPGVTALHVKTPVLFVAPTENVVKLPGVVSVTVTVLVLVLAVAPTAEKEVLQALIAAARFVAKLDGVEAVIKVPLVELGHVCVPLLPPVTLPHVKIPLLFVAATENVVKVPGVVSVTVTVLPLALAVAPTAEKEVLQALIASRRFVARFAVLESVTKVPVVALVHVCVPFVPGVTPPHVKMLVLFVAPTVNVVKLPGVLSVTVTVLPLAPAVTPAATGQELIAAARFVAKVVVLLLVAKVPEVDVEQVGEPLELPVTLPQAKPVMVSATERKAPGVVSVTVTVLVLAVAVTPTVLGNAVLQALIASRRFAANPDVVPAVIKVPLVELEHPLVPSVPAVTPLQEKLPLMLVPPTENCHVLVVPTVVALTVTWLALPPVPCVALTPAAAGQALSAAVRFAAKVDVLELVAKVPVAEFAAQVFVPSEPLVPPLKEEWLS